MDGLLSDMHVADHAKWLRECKAFASVAGELHSSAVRVASTTFVEFNADSCMLPPFCQKLSCLLTIHSAESGHPCLVC